MASYSVATPTWANRRTLAFHSDCRHHGFGVRESDPFRPSVRCP